MSKVRVAKALFNYVTKTGRMVKGTKKQIKAWKKSGKPYKADKIKLYKPRRIKRVPRRPNPAGDRAVEQALNKIKKGGMEAGRALVAHKKEIAKLSKTQDVTMAQRNAMFNRRMRKLGSK